jgi:hypothetical protein
MDGSDRDNSAIRLLLAKGSWDSNRHTADTGNESQAVS